MVCRQFQALEIFVRERRDRETAEGRSRHKHVMNVEEELTEVIGEGNGAFLKFRNILPSHSGEPLSSIAVLSAYLLSCDDVVK